MKNTRIILIVGFLIAYAPNVISRVYSDANCCERTCCEPEYNCGTPLNCGSLNFWVRGGVVPTSWRDRGNFSAVSCNALAITGFGKTIVDFFRLPQFKKLFHLPWTVGGQIGYAVTNCFEFYTEFNYRTASRRIFTANNVSVANGNDVENITLTLSNNYRVFDAYVGGRYYWGRYWCDRFALFLGGKFGLVHHNAVCFNYNITSVSCPGELVSPGDTQFFFRNTRPAAGLNVGIDWCLNCGWSFMVMGEIVASCGGKSNGNIRIAANEGCPTQLPNIGAPTNLIVGGTGTELFFPVTFGLKYSF